MIYDNMFDLGYHLASVCGHAYRAFDELGEGISTRAAVCWDVARIVKYYKQEFRCMTDALAEQVVDIRTPSAEFPEGEIKPGPIPAEFSRGVEAYLTRNNGRENEAKHE